MKISRGQTESSAPLEFFFRVETFLDQSIPGQTLKQRAEQLQDQMGNAILVIPGVIGVTVKERGLKNTPLRKTVQRDK